MGFRAAGAGSAIVAITALGLASCGRSAQSENPGRMSQAACQDGDENFQRYGTDCLCCHESEFGVAGSVDKSSDSLDRIVVVDILGQTAEMSPNPYGNFFRHVRLRPPLRATAISNDGRESNMRSTAPSGSCNQCHGQSVPRIQGPVDAGDHGL